MIGEQPRETLIPKLKSGVDIRRLPITPTEAFVLSRVDGRASGSEIALATGFPAAEVIAILQKLDGLGAVQYGDGTAPRAESSPAPAPERGSSPALTSGVRTDPGPLAYDPSELDESADLDPDRKHLILQTFYRLDALNAYELLGVADDADKKAIKKAYYDVVGRFHPDRYFGKKLGGFKPKLEKIFQQITEAHDTLTRAQSRADYDRYLESTRATRAFEQPAPASIDEIKREIEEEASLGAGASSPGSVEPVADSGASVVTAPSDAEALRSPSSGPVAARAWSDSPRPSLSAEDRRRALARKLRASIPPTPRPSAPDGAGPNVKQVAADALRRRYEARLEQARAERVQRYVQQSDDAMTAGNFVAAANALRIAVSLVPDDVPLTDQLEKVEKRASAALADQYLEQARYDERRGHMADAAHTYEKVLRGRPSSYVYERAAHCLVESNGDLKKASDFAKKAVELSPNETAYRITLARIYAKAGMEASAAGELERARTLDPNDDTVKDWLKRLKRGEI